MDLKDYPASPSTDASRHNPPFYVNRSFAWLWIGQTLSSLGSHISSNGIAIAAILLLQATPLQLGLLVACSSVPVLALSLLTGAWIDRLPRRPILILADLGRALLLCLIPLAFVTGQLHIGLLYLVTAMVSILTIFFMVSLRSFLPVLQRGEDLVQANSKLGISEALAEIGGPPFAVWLIQCMTAPLAIIFDALSFLISAYCLWRIRIPERSVESSGNEEQVESRTEPFWRDICDGIAVVLHHPYLRGIAAYIAMFNFCGGAFATFYIVYIIRVLGFSTLTYGILVMMGGIGNLIGASLASSLARRFGTGRAMTVGALMFGVLALFTPLASGHALPTVMLLMGVQLLGDCALPVYAVNEISWRQRAVPEHLLGRVNACMYVLEEGIGPLGAIVAAVFCQMANNNVRLTLWIGAIGMLLACGWLIGARLWRLNNLTVAGE
jgi:predicted MFS family arabinose efflux permease